MLVVLVGADLLSSHLYISISRYLEYKVTSMTETSIDREQTPFPDVTVCSSKKREYKWFTAIDSANQFFPDTTAESWSDLETQDSIRHASHADKMTNIVYGELNCYTLT